MPRKLTYIPGNTYGPYNLLLVKRSERTDKYGKHKYGWYKCYDCGEIFEALNQGVKIGDVIRCKSCRTKWKKENSVFNTLNKQYYEGMRVGPNNILFIKELGYAPNTKYRTGYFECPVCGTTDWHTRLNDICSGASSKCPDCYKKENILRLSKNSDNLALDLIGQQFGELTVVDRADYEQHKYGRLWLCKCSCGNTREAYSRDLTSGKIWHCGCLEPRSKGEDKIATILSDNNILYTTEYTFDDCISPKTNKKLRFDFYIPHINTCIEYDGIQHFKETTWKHESLSEVQYRDAIKNKYCEDHNIRLIRIPYWDYDKLNEEYLLDLISKEQTCATHQH